MLKRYWYLFFVPFVLFGVLFLVARRLVAQRSELPEAVVARGIVNGRLTACPDSPNCVSTQDTDATHGMDVLPLGADIDAARADINQILREMPGVTFVTVNPDYIHAEFRSPFWGFVDDVEFQFDVENAAIHFRSASRLGYGDMGANRKRMETIREQYLSEIER